jgi:hypothetical protein
MNRFKRIIIGACPPNPICKVGNSLRLVLTLCLALTLTFFAGCFDSSDDNDKGIKLPQTDGELIINSASAIEGKYVQVSADLNGIGSYSGDVWLEGYSEIIELVWGTSVKHKLPKVKDGTVTIPLYVENEDDETITGYSGSDTPSVDLYVYDEETDDSTELSFSKYNKNITFSDGKATVNWTSL